MKKREILLAVSVLSVLAGLLTVGYAQSQGEPEEIRRWLIDRIETAYAAGDTDTLQRLAEAERQRERDPSGFVAAMKDPAFRDFVDREYRNEMVNAIQRASVERLVANVHRLSQCRSASPEPLPLQTLTSEDGLASVVSAATEAMCETWASIGNDCWLEYNDCVQNNPDAWADQCGAIRSRCEMWEELQDLYCVSSGWPAFPY